MSIYGLAFTKQQRQMGQLVIVMLLVFVSFALPVRVHAADDSASSSSTISKQDQDTIKQRCADALGNNGSKIELGACFEGYVLALNGQDSSSCQSAYKNHPNAIDACSKTGYDLGQKAANRNAQQQAAQNGGGGSNDDQVKAGNLPQGPCSSEAACTNNIESIFNIVFGIAGALALLMIVVSGFRYIVSAGDPQGTSKAKSGIVYALVGLIVAIMADAIVNFVINRL
jgi:hypothetical protein